MEERRRIPLERILPYLAPVDEGDLAQPDRDEIARIRETLPSSPQPEGSWEGVRLTLALKTPEGAVEITSVADAVFLENGVYYIEEALVADDFFRLPAPVREAAQIRGMILALALANTKDLPEVGVALYLYGAGDVRREAERFSRDALREEVSRTLAPVLPLLPALWEQERSKVKFPYEHLRDGQRDLMDGVWSTVKSGGTLFACAPTGIGKTAAVLYPALKALEKGKAEKVFYASPKNTLKRQAAECVQQMQEEGTIRTLTLAAKMSLCPLGLEECVGKGCEYCEDLNRRCAPALAELYQAVSVGPDELRAAGEHYALCPFELALKATAFSQVIIGDYNHVFDPRFSVCQEGKDRVLLVDEAHNLPSRIRESYTETLCPGDLDPFYREESLPGQMLREHFEPLATLFAQRRKKYREDKKDFSFEKPEEAAALAEGLLPKLRFVLGDGFGSLPEPFRLRVRALYRKVKKFASLCRDFGGEFVQIFLPDGGCRVYLADPRKKIRAVTDKWKATVFFSATLEPREYYFSILAGEEGDRYLSLASPFPRENLFVGLCPVDVSFSRRFDSARELCSVIRAATRARVGNYMVFLPSFDYLELVSQEYKRRFLDDRVLIQKRVMYREERSRFLEEFRQTRDRTLVGFCVMGGIFSEGIDLQGESLVGEIVVGTGFPPPSAEAEAESALYYRKDMDGKNFAYTLPGWSRVLQAAGRVIRSEEDRGVLVLCDERYLREDMRELFPDAWEDAVLCETEKSLSRNLERFWAES